MISIFHVIMIFLSIYYISKGGFRTGHRWLNPIVTIFLFSIAIGVLMGLKNVNQISNVFGDGGMYLLALMVLVCASSKRVRQISINEFLLLTYKASSIMLFVCLIMYLTRSLSFWKMISFNGGRYFGGFLSILIITLPYGVYNHIHLRNIRLWSLAIHVLLGFFCMIIAQSRATIIASVLGVIFVLYFGSRKISVKNIIQIIILSTIAILGLSFLMRSSFDVIGRILSTDFSNRSETLYARLYLYQYYISQISSNPLGKGFGSIMYFLTPQLSLMTDTGTYTIDAALMAAGYKGGWLMCFVYAFSMITEIVVMVKLFRKTHDKVYLVMLVSQVLFIASTGLITGQIIHTYTPLVYFWTFMGLCGSNSLVNINNTDGRGIVYVKNYKKNF